MNEDFDAEIALWIYKEKGRETVSEVMAVWDATIFEKVICALQTGCIDDLKIDDAQIQYMRGVIVGQKLNEAN